VPTKRLEIIYFSIPPMAYLEEYDEDGKARINRLWRWLRLAGPCYLLPVSSQAVNTENSLNYFLNSFGPASQPTLYLGWVFSALVTAILLLIILLVLWAVYHPRAQDSFTIADERPGVHWIYTGTGISTFILIILAVYSLTILNTITKPATPPALTITVTGYDWWWKIDYEANSQNPGFVTANELHIPVGVPVMVNLKSVDVIHAFWVPLLAGKTQMIPGMTNRQWLQADKEGIYRGQCTQFCGLQHAHMNFEVIAQSAAEFEKWRLDQSKPVRRVATNPDSEGEKLFVERCGGCHTVRGTEAKGNHGPDLTHLNSRRSLGAGLLSNTPEQLMRWITHTQELKPGARMPSMRLTPAEITDMSAFLLLLD
jgi:cytochrome c oxidase subunit II